MGNPVAFPATPQRVSHTVEFVRMLPTVVVRCFCVPGGVSVVIEHLYHPGVCERCQAQYWVAITHHDKPAWQKEQEAQGKDPNNINEVPTQVVISRIEPRILIPKGQLPS